MAHPAFNPTQRARRAAALIEGGVVPRADGRGPAAAASQVSGNAGLRMAYWVREAGVRAAAVRAARTVRAVRYAGAVLTLCMSAAAGLLPGAAHAQEAGGPIVIPGPGEKNPAALAEMTARLQAATPAAHVNATTSLNAATAQTMAPSPAARDADVFTRAANASGSIVIPGTDEAPAAPAMIKTSFKPDANGVVTIPPPGAAQAAMSGLSRMNVAPAARQTAQVSQTGQTGQGRLAVVPVIVSREVSSPRSAAVPAVQPVAVNAPGTAGFDSLTSRGEPPQLGANGKPIATTPARAVTLNAASAISVQANAAPIARMPVARTPAPAASIQPALAQQNPRAAVPTPASAAPLPGQQDPEAIRSTALAFLQQQSAGLPGKVEITVAQAFPRGLASCTSLEPFMPSGSRMWGRMTVGVRCAGERPWTIYLQARVSLRATYYLAARAMAPGEVLGTADLVARDGDLTGLPQAVVTDPAQAVGSVSLTRIAAGMPLRQDMLRSASAVTIGQTVKVVAAGEGFAISADGSAMNNASPGQQVRVKTANGQIISGIVKDGSTVEIPL